MRASSLTRALEAMASMEKGRPYALRPEDAKPQLADEVARICEAAGVKPVVIGGPLPVPALPELIALKVMSGRARDDADVVELLKRHGSRMAALKSSAGRRLRTDEARKRLAALVARARSEAARRR